MSHDQDAAAAAALGRRAMAALVGAIVFAFVVAFALLTWIADDQDVIAEARSVALENHAWQGRRDLLATTLEDYAAWGAAYANLHVRVDIDWAYAQANLGDTVFNRLGFTHVFVVGPSGETRYALVDGALSSSTVEDTFGPSVADLIARARQAAGTNTTVTTPGLLTIGGDPAIVSAAAISTGADWTVTPIPGPASVMLFAERMAPARLKALGSRYFVDNLRVARDAVDAAAAPAVHLAFENGAPLTLRWDPERPGRRLVETVLPLVLCAGAAMAMLLALFARDSRRASGLIRASERRLQAAYRDVERKAMHDATTGLPNRLMLDRHMDERLQDPTSRLALLFLDLDRFKPVNDAHGHAAGDEVLQQVAERLRRSLPEGDLVARVGGDEFVVVAGGLDQEGVERLCRRLIATVAAPIRHAFGEVRLGLSIGVAMPQPECDAGELMRHADLALYRAKEAGRGTYRFFASEMNDKILGRRKLEAELWRGLEQREFVLDFQPRYDARSMRVRRAEALLRWRHPTRGLVGPSEFVPLAEETGLIVPLGEWVMRAACAAAVRWPDIGVSVNVSAVQMRDDGLSAVVADALLRSGLEPSRLEIEITESVLIEDADRARAVMLELKALGVRLAMDDFGTGYSSLGYLRSFPFDAIKIDRRFVADLAPRGEARAIVQAILGLGRALGLTVTAEGVETPEQLMLLRVDSCDEVQGFYLARPLAEPDLLDLLDAAQTPEPRSASARTAG
ncbi:putative bifunctional diguanylate cyclase/phosphodiesterase [Methylopila sp. Yamaguchi]|uniref:putative bifunctional diguanylate cyclase/phosphodiesterase n=1 Tax=Methylopila sp. Yamaguchi TaxID=1437817 RepID=UPI000CCBEBD9|nr:EAL domain-containing protein [Methylopila sp. Yamaguchi]